MFSELKSVLINVPLNDMSNVDCKVALSRTFDQNKIEKNFFIYKPFEIFWVKIYYLDQQDKYYDSVFPRPITCH